MIPLSEARQIIAQKVRPLAPVTLPLAELHGRVLREAVAAREDFPAFDRSAMDGYAIAEDDSARFKIIGEAQPGEMPAVVVGKGECVRIFTGAPIPPGASQVIMQEDVERDGEWMKPTRRSSESHVRYRGEDAREGDVLLEADTRVGSGEAALLAQLGAVRALVSPQPRVLHFATGNELVSPAEQPAPGQIRDSNSTLIAALLAESGVRLVMQHRCGDNLQMLADKIRSAPEDSWDLLLLSGGASVGDYDFGRRALADLGFEIHFPQIDLRPGKPLIFATRGRQAAFVIPGNPVSHFVVFHVAIRAALQCLEGVEPSWPLVQAALSAPLPTRSNPRETYWPAQLRIREGAWSVHPLTWQSSGDLRGLVGANALIQIRGGASPGSDLMPCLVLSEF